MGEVPLRSLLTTQSLLANDVEVVLDGEQPRVAVLG
jgi:hypothetical protein